VVVGNSVATVTVVVNKTTNNLHPTGSPRRRVSQGSARDPRRRPHRATVDTTKAMVTIATLPRRVNTEATRADTKVIREEDIRAINPAHLPSSMAKATETASMSDLGHINLLVILVRPVTTQAIAVMEVVTVDELRRTLSCFGQWEGSLAAFKISG
jgi:hypothetical protein